MTRRVVVTGMGVVSSLGLDVPTAFARLKIYKNTVTHDTSLEGYKGLYCHLRAPVTGFSTPPHLTRKTLRTMDYLSIMAVESAEQAVKQAELLENPLLSGGRTGVAYGSSFGSVKPMLDFFNMSVTRKVGLTSSSYIKIMPHTCAVNLSLYFKTRGRIIPTGTACTSGSLAIGYAYEAIKYGLQDIMIAGAADEARVEHVAIFDTLYATSTKNDAPHLTPRPFDKDRDGLVVGEGAATLVLEDYEHAKTRGATILAEIAGFGSNTDGVHETNPNKDTMAEVLRTAITDAGISSDMIGYVNAHGTATKNGDSAETGATREVFKRAIPISSLKSYTGHTLGTCGALEAIMSVMMMRNNWYAPTINLDNVAQNCGDLDYIMHEGRAMEASYVMSNNFAFGGINTSLILRSSNS